MLLRVNLVVGVIFVSMSIVYLVNLAQQNGGLRQSVLPNGNSGPSVTNFSGIADCLNNSGGWANVNQCYDQFIHNYAGDTSIKQLLGDLETLRAQNPAVETGCHPIAHAIGRYAYQKHGNVGDAFENCDYTCHSGCYHGVMERTFYTDEQISAGVQHVTYDQLAGKIPTICSADKFSNPTQQIIFQCLHGIGHAILYSLNYNLDDALKLCDLLPTSYDQRSCYGGVIMENVTAFDTSKRDIKQDDPQYPCNRLPEVYKTSCYAMQTSVMYNIGLSTAEIAKECRNAGVYQSTCMVSLGRDLSNKVRSNEGNEVVHTCEVLADGNTRECVQGSVYALVDNTWDGKYAFQFCGMLQKDENRRNCFTDTIRYMRTSHEKSKQQVVSDCNTYAGQYADTCKQYVN
jgi:hypothetical protein